MINTKAVKMWMIKEDLTQRMIAEEAGQHYQYVWQVLHGRRLGARVREVLLRRGCPPRFLGNPPIPPGAKTGNKATRETDAS